MVEVVEAEAELVKVEYLVVVKEVVVEAGLSVVNKEAVAKVEFLVVRKEEVAKVDDLVKMEVVVATQVDSEMKVVEELVAENLEDKKEVENVVG